ncbi:MAG: hypothetical protein H0U26_06400 [Acidimicrobiia bacterium]|nr:hypothetical protein [Acidimicrobiia bacterium]
MPDVQGVDARGSELFIAAANGAATIGPVAIALNEAAVAVRDLTLRTPTLDDVFLELTGSRIESDADADTDTDHADRNLQEATR